MKKISLLFVLAFLLMPVLISAQQKQNLLEKMPEIYKAPVTVAVGKINPALYKTAGDITVQSFTVSPSTINTGETVNSVIRWVSVSGGTVKVRLPYPGGAVDSTTVSAIAGTIYETRFWHSVSVVGTHTLTVSVMKGTETGTATAILVVNGLTNRPPSLTLNPVGPYTVAENSTLNIALIGSDLDVGDVLTYSVTVTPFMTGATLNSATGAFSWTPIYGSVGTYNVTFTVSDNHGGTAVVNTAITVAHINQLPQITAFYMLSSVIVGEKFSITVKGEDPDGTTLSFSLTVGLVGTGGVVYGPFTVVGITTAQELTKIFSDLTVTAPGNYMVRLVLSDVNGAINEGISYFTAVNPNSAPVIEFVGYSGVLNYPDPQNIVLKIRDDGNNVSITSKIYSLPYGTLNDYQVMGKNIVPNTSVYVAFNPVTLPVGDYICYITVSDSYLDTSTSFTFKVQIPTGVEEMGIPAEFSLTQNYPNPFNPSTKIKFALPNSEFVTLKVYDVLGEEVATLVDEQKGVGYYEVKFDAGNLPSGIYLYRIQAGKFVQTQKMTLIK